MAAIDSGFIAGNSLILSFSLECRIDLVFFCCSSAFVVFAVVFACYWFLHIPAPATASQAMAAEG